MRSGGCQSLELPRGAEDHRKRHVESGPAEARPIIIRPPAPARRASGLPRANGWSHRGMIPAMSQVRVGSMVCCGGAGSALAGAVTCGSDGSKPPSGACCGAPASGLTALMSIPLRSAFPTSTTRSNYPPRQVQGAPRPVRRCCCWPGQFFRRPAAGHPRGQGDITAPKNGSGGWIERPAHSAIAPGWRCSHRWPSRRVRVVQRSLTRKQRHGPPVGRAVGAAVVNERVQIR
jgi:hypothetical protein